MQYPNTRKRLLIVDSYDAPGVGQAFRPKFEQYGIEVAVATDEAEQTVVSLLDRQKFDAMLFFYSEGYHVADAKWSIAPADWAIMDYKKRSLNAATPVVAVVIDPDEATVRRLHEYGVVQVIDRPNELTAQDLIERVLPQLGMK